MKIETENIYSILPFDNHVKFNIYTQLYKKKHFMVTDEFKNELTYYLKYKDVVSRYRNKYGDNDYTYKLLENFIFYFYNKSMEETDCRILKDSIFNGFFQIMNMNLRFMSQKLHLYYTKQVWNYMNTEQRQSFCSVMCI